MITLATIVGLGILIAVAAFAAKRDPGHFGSTNLGE